jgi:hypothetical protein
MDLRQQQQHQQSPSDGADLKAKRRLSAKYVAWGNRKKSQCHAKGQLVVLLK